MRLAVVFALWVVVALPACAACGDADGVAPDAAPRVTGCDDPTLWTAQAVDTGSIGAHVGGGACSAAQYPLHRAIVSWWADHLDIPYQERARYTACWRVTEASPDSGWAAGQAFATTGDYGAMYVKGFARPVTIEGRVLRPDGTVTLALAPETIKLDEAIVRLPDARAVTVAITEESWAERDTMNMWGQRVPTEEVVDATGGPAPNNVNYSVHRTATGFVWRRWGLTNGQLTSIDVALGPGTRARLARFGGAIVVDNDLITMRQEPNQPVGIRNRIPLTAEPSEIVGDGSSVVLHIDDALVRYGIFGTSTTPETLAVGAGVLLPRSHLETPVFFDGTTFHGLARDGLAFDDRASFTPHPEALAALGTPVAVMHGIAFGANGLMAGYTSNQTGVPTETAGPQYAAYAELFGDGQLGLASTTSTTYVIAHDDGSAQLYYANYSDYCE